MKKARKQKRNKSDEKRKKEETLKRLDRRRDKHRRAYDD